MCAGHDAFIVQPCSSTTPLNVSRLGCHRRAPSPRATCFRLPGVAVLKTSLPLLRLSRHTRPNRCWPSTRKRTTTTARSGTLVRLVAAVLKTDSAPRSATMLLMLRAPAQRPARRQVQHSAALQPLRTPQHLGGHPWKNDESVALWSLHHHAGLGDSTRAEAGVASAVSGRSGFPCILQRRR